MNKPRYVELHRSGELERRALLSRMALKECDLCPRECRITRLSGEHGFCGAGGLARVYAYGPHHGEEPPLSGTRGAGTIFFSHCTMRCLYCQNFPFSSRGKGSDVTAQELAEIMIWLQDEGCHNIELVSSSHYIPQILAALLIAIEDGLTIPLVYNTNGYEKVQTLQLLDNVVEIYLPDYKYGRDEEGLELSVAPNYTRFARAAIREMYRQAGKLRMENGIAQRGLIIRHLLLPSNCNHIEKALGWIAANFPADITVSLMGQYIPLHNAPHHHLLSRRLTQQEIENALDLATELGFTNLLYQEGLDDGDELMYRGDKLIKSMQSEK